MKLYYPTSSLRKKNHSDHPLTIWTILWRIEYRTTHRRIDFRNVCGCETYPLLKTINRALGRIPSPGPDCYLDQERNDLDGVVVENIDFENAAEETRGQCTEPLLKGHSTDCNKYFICEFGLLREQSCPSSLYFNKVKKRKNTIDFTQEEYSKFPYG